MSLPIPVLDNFFSPQFMAVGANVRAILPSPPANAANIIKFNNLQNITLVI